MAAMNRLPITAGNIDITTKAILGKIVDEIDRIDGAATIVGLTATAAELNTNAGVTPGTAAASKTAVLGTSKNLDILGLPVGGLKIGAAGAEVVVTPTAAELNVNAGVTPGTAAASKTVVLDGTSSVTGLGTVGAANLNASTAATVTSANANALAVGRLGATTPAFSVDASTAVQAAGMRVTGAASGGTVALAATDSGAATNVTIDAKGTGTIGIGTTSTGKITLAPAAGTVLAAAYAAQAVSATTVGTVLGVSTSGIYTGIDGVFEIDAIALTSGTAQATNITGATTGIGVQVAATAATLTTGRYFSANDTTTGEVFGVGTNGHIISTASASVPTIVVTAQVGITAAAITAGGSDTCGIITTTGTSTGATILDVTFGKTYTTAPKFVHIAPANAAAAMPNTGYFVSAITATGFTITVAAGGTYAATPSFRYVVIA